MKIEGLNIKLVLSKKEKATAIILVILILLLITNPTKQQYVEWAKDKAIDIFGVKNQPIVALIGDTVINQFTRRSSWLFFSLYYSQFADKEYTSIGFLGNFIMLNQRDIPRTTFTDGSIYNHPKEKSNYIILVNRFRNLLAGKEYFPLSQHIELPAIGKGFRGNWGSGSSRGDYIEFLLTLKNKGPIDIDTVKIQAVCKDSDNNTIHTFNFSSLKEIKSGENQQIRKFIKLEQDNDFLKKLKQMELRDLKIEWDPQEIIFSDGTKLLNSGEVIKFDPAQSKNLELPAEQNVIPAIPLKTANGNSNGDINVYAGPHVFSAAIGTIKENTHFMLKNSENRYYFIDHNGLKGWLKNENIKSR